MDNSHFPFALYATGFATAGAGSLVLTYAVREHARRAGLFDGTDGRKLHTAPTPRVGGIAIFLSVAIALGALVAVFGIDTLREQTHGRGLRAVLAGGAAMHLLGLWDDLRPMRARWKLVGQVVISAAVFFAGLRIGTLALPFVGLVAFGPIVGFLITVFWFVGITNAFNLIDGLDGLASGAALFALVAMFVVGGINGQSGAALVTIVVAAATLGFLYYNFHPATIFLGDSGSLFLGFMLAGLGVMSSQKSQTVVAVAIPLVALGLPVLDTALAIARRFLRGQPIFSADRGHIHHQLLGLGHSPRTVALLLYAACAALALGGMLLVTDSSYVAVVLIVVGLGVGLAIQRLRYYEFQEVARIFRRGLRQREVIGRNVRLREATLILGELQDMDDIFTALGEVFAMERFLRSEIRVRQSYIDYDPVTPGPDRRVTDDIPVWTWTGAAIQRADWWEIMLPLIHPCGDRIGCLVLWHDGFSAEASLSHVHTIARELREVVQAKLVALWPSPAYMQRDSRPPVAGERIIPLAPARETLVRGEAGGVGQRRRTASEARPVA